MEELWILMGGPRPGVQIIEKGTQHMSIADYEGKYSIVVQDTISTLQFLCVGYLSRELTVNRQHEINTKLRPEVIYEMWNQKIGLYLNCGIIKNPVGD